MKMYAYRSKYQTSQYRFLRYSKVLDIFPALLLITSTQRQTDDPRLDRLDVVRIVENVSELRVLGPEHDEERYRSDDSKDADQNVSPLQKKHVLNVFPGFHFGNGFATLDRIVGLALALTA
jgi:hypothetical protein